VFLDAAVKGAERLEATGGVATTIDTRSLTGERLIYHASEERYEVSGRAGAPVRLVEPCRETVGRALTFYKSTDRVVVDGEGRGRTRTEGRGACPPSPTR
jgi:lipopolysaccharide export system protein LptA